VRSNGANAYGRELIPSVQVADSFVISLFR
jgi:hypothetical protein